MPLQIKSKRLPKGFQYGSSGSRYKKSQDTGAGDKVQISPNAQTALNALKYEEPLAPQDIQALQAPFVGAERGWLGRLFSGPGFTSNPTVEGLNRQVLVEDVLRQIQEPKDLAFLEKEAVVKLQQEINAKKTLGPIEAAEAARKTFSIETGLPPELYDAFKEQLTSRASAKFGAEEREATAREEKATTAGRATVATRTSDIAKATTDAERAALLSGYGLESARAPIYKEALNAATLAGLLRGPVDLQAAGRLDLTPGETSFVPSIQELFPEGSSALKMLPSSGVGRGITSQRKTTYTNIGGVNYPTGTEDVEVPGSFMRDVPLDLGDLSRFREGRDTTLQSVIPKTSTGLWDQERINQLLESPEERQKKKEQQELINSLLQPTMGSEIMKRKKLEERLREIQQGPFLIPNY